MIRWCNCTASLSSSPLLSPAPCLPIHALPQLLFGIFTQTHTHTQATHTRTCLTRSFSSAASFTGIRNFLSQTSCIVAVCCWFLLHWFALARRPALLPVCCCRQHEERPHKHRQRREKGRNVFLKKKWGRSGSGVERRKDTARRTRGGGERERKEMRGESSHIRMPSASKTYV